MESKPETPEDAQKDGRDKGCLEVTGAASVCQRRTPGGLKN